MRIVSLLVLKNNDIKNVLRKDAKMEYLQKLEYNKILEKLASYCHLEASKKEAYELKPYIEIKDIKQKLEETTEAVNLIYRCSTPPAIEFIEDKEEIKIIKTEGTLSLKSIINLTKILKISGLLKKYITSFYGYLEIWRFSASSACENKKSVSANCPTL